MIFVLLTLIFLLGIFLLVKKAKTGNQNQNVPPGPWGLPLLGHLVFLGRNPHLTLMKWKKKYGPIIHIRFGSFPTVVLSDSKLIKEAFNMNELSGRPQIQVYVENSATKGIVLSEGPYNTELRQFAIKKLKEFGMGRKALEDQIHEGISEFMDFIKLREGVPIKSEEFPSAHMIRTLWSIMMTDELNPADAERMHHFIEKLCEIGPVLSELAGFIPWMEKAARIISFGHFSFLTHRAKQIQEIHSFINKFLQEKKMKWAKVQGQGQVPTDIMEMYLEKMAETTDKSSPFHASQGSAMTFLYDVFGASIHTTNVTLLWMYYYMARNPEVQLKLQEEIDQVVGNSRLPSLSDRGQMPYTAAAVHELLRMSSVLPVGAPHKATADVCFHGYTIKKDTMIFANTYEIHQDPKIWGDPQSFRPERWFGEQGQKLKNENFLPFLTGRRNCPGDGLAREQLFLYITTLFQQFSVEFDSRKVPKVKGSFGISLAPTQFTVVFNKRKSNT